MIRRYLLNTMLPALVLALVFTAGNAFAEYEPVSPQPKNAVTGFEPVKGPDEDLEVGWSAPTMGAGDSIVEYVYKWTTSATTLDDTQLSRDVNDGTVSGDVDPPFVTTEKSFFAGDDESTLRYLHIKTAYLTEDGPGLSDDVVVGPFNFDNVKPDGSAVLDSDADGQTAATSSVNPVALRVTVASVYTAKVYTSNTPTRPATAKASFVGYTTVTHTVSEGTGSKTIYYWLEDYAGNRSDPKTLTFTMTAGKSMDPPGDLELATGATRSFTIKGKGADEKFDWSFTDENPAGVASFVGDSQDVAQVTVKGEQEGTFKVKAVSRDDQVEYASGTVTVTGPAFTLDIDGNGQTTPLGDGVMIVRYLFGFRGQTLIQGAIDTQGTRNTAADIETYIATGLAAGYLDVDGNAESKPLEDGVMIVRRLFGFSGATLTSGAVGSGSTRDAGAIEAYIDALK